MSGDLRGKGVKVRPTLNLIVVKKSLWTLLFLFVYVLGSQLTLPFLDMKAILSENNASHSLYYVTSLMGSNLRSLSLFSIGLSPWMSAMLIWQMFSSLKILGLDTLPIEVQERRRMYLTLVIAFIQSLALVINLPLQTGRSTIGILLLNILILIAGTFFLIWLADLNAAMGLGGSVMIVMVGMIAYVPQDIWSSIQEFNIKPIWIASLSLVSLLFLYLAVVVERSKYRIPVNKMTIHNRFKDYSYLDIRLNPAGGMPIMYAITVVGIPQYFLLFLLFFQPNNLTIGQWIIDLSTGELAWFLLYLLTIFALSLIFSFVNVNGEQIADRMQRNGEYIEDVYPGLATEKFINRLVFRFAIFGAIYLIVLSGLPMMILLWDSRYIRLSVIPGIFLIFIGMVFTIRDEIEVLTLNERYQSLL